MSDERLEADDIVVVCEISHKKSLYAVTIIQQVLIMKSRLASKLALSLFTGLPCMIVVVAHADDSTTASEQKCPALYVLSIGVAEYQDDKLQRRYADRDAQLVVQTFREHSGDLFDKIETRLVVNNDATQEGILEGLKWLKQKMTEHDVGVMYFAGNAVKDETGSHYLMPSDVDTRVSLVLSVVSDAMVKSILVETPGRLFVLLDVDHAGAFAAVRRKNTQKLTDDLVRDLSKDDCGTVVMAACMSREVCHISDEHKNGVFTFALREGLTGKADFNGDGKVYFNELSFYAGDRTKELTSGQQHPVTATPSTIRAFPLTTLN